MSWTLTSAVLICGLRRGRTAVLAQPLPAALVLAILLASPLLALASGRELAPIVAAAGADPTLARALCAALALPALLVGATIGAFVPDVRTIGAQLAAAPVARVTRFVSVTLAPLLLIAAAISVPAFVGALAAAADARPGRWLAVTLVAAFVAAAAGGAAAVAIAGVARDTLALVGLGGALGALWLAVGAVFGEPALGLVSPVSRALHGEPGSALAGAGVAVLGAFAAIALWATAAALAPAADHDAGRARLPMRIPTASGRAFAVATVARLSRHGQVRRHLVLATVVAGGSAIAARLAGMPDQTAVYVAFAAALVAAAGVPPAAFALARDAPWLTRVAPSPTVRGSRAVAVAAAAGSSAVIAGVLLVAAPLARPTAAMLPAVELAAAVVIAAAVAGGALAPWRPERVLEQTATYVVVGAFAAALAWGVGRAATQAAAAGLPEGAVAALTANAAVVGAIVFAGRVAR